MTTGKKKKRIGLSQTSLLIGNTTQGGQPWNYVHKTTKMDSVSCIYLFVHTHTYIYTCVCNKKFKEKVAINSRMGREHEKY